MKKYEVVSGCYVPLGNGGTRYKRLGQIVTLSDEQAAALAGFIKPVVPSGGVAFRNTGIIPVEPEAIEQHVLEETVEEVTSNAGDPEADNERVIAGVS